MQQQITEYAVRRVLHDSLKLDRHLRPAAMSGLSKPCSPQCSSGGVSVYAWRAHQALLENRDPE